ncbi:unnamed protein product [Symbiodinium natans]|uniref:Uncharacterized protein n=1 Tax=Symbiodinium natans TaxID=878477 RepID=A0A812IWS3_9DINO|nr:unnamed protein product [Symbiodinium natans]
MLLAPEGAACSLQAMRGVMFLIVWRKGHIIMALRPQRMSQLPPCRYVPELGFACVVVGHVVVCILNEIDKFWGCSKTVCGVSPRLMNCAFWLGWCVLVVMCSIPMLAVAYFCFDFALKGLESCHIFSSDGAVISEDFEDAARWSGILFVVFGFLSMLEAVLWLWVHVLVPDRKKLQPEVTPSLLSRTGGYVSVEGQETEDKMVMSACCAAP